MDNSRVRVYVNRVITRSVEICGARLRAVLLFGSVASGQFEEGVSDIDLILVVSDETESQVFAQLESALRQLETAYGPLKNRGHFLNTFASRTALFKSHFIIRQSTLASLDAKKLFHEAQGFNFSLGRFLLPLAPSRLVLRNVLTSGIVVYGEKILPGPKPIYPEPSSVARNFLVSLVMSVFGALSTVFFRDGTMFSLEAAKWFFLNHNSYATGKNVSLPQAVRFIEGSAPRLFLHSFLDLRLSYRRSVAFSFTCPLYLTLTFLSTARKRA